MVGVGKSHGYDHVAHPDVEGRGDEVSQVELLQGHFAALLDFHLILAVLTARLCFNLIGDSRASGLKLHLGTENPLRGNLVFTFYHEAGYGNLAMVLLRVAYAVAVETVQSVVLEGSQYLAVASYAPFVIALHFVRGGLGLYGLHFLRVIG